MDVSCDYPAISLIPMASSTRALTSSGESPRRLGLKAISSSTVDMNNWLSGFLETGSQHAPARLPIWFFAVSKQQVSITPPCGFEQSTHQLQERTLAGAILTDNCQPVAPF